MVGGVREAQVFAPNTYKFVCAKRRGFARVGLETGASLVPAISFGECFISAGYFLSELFIASLFFDLIFLVFSYRWILI